ARYSAALCGADELTLMLLDVLSDLDEVKICTAYELSDGSRLTRTEDFPAETFLLEKCKPVYERLPGWQGDLGAARQLADLPAGARRYVDRLAELLGLPVSIVSVGADRVQTIVCD